MEAPSVYPLTVPLAQAQGEVGAHSQEAEDPRRHDGDRSFLNLSLLSHR